MRRGLAKATPVVDSLEYGRFGAEGLICHQMGGQIYLQRLIVGLCGYIAGATAIRPRHTPTHRDTAYPLITTTHTSMITVSAVLT